MTARESRIFTAHLQRIIKLEKACRLAIPCLEDWIRTTGFGEVNQRDNRALKAIYKALEVEK